MISIILRPYSDDSWVAIVTYPVDDHGYIRKVYRVGMDRADLIESLQSDPPREVF